MSEEKEGQKIDVPATKVESTTNTVSTSYTSAFPKRQLDFAKISRDRAGEIESLFDNNPDKISQRKKQEHQKEVISTVTNSIAFLKGQKNWFKIKLNNGKLDIQNEDEIEGEIDWRETEDAFAKTAKIKNGKTRLKESKAYEDVKTLRTFRNTLQHFKPVHRNASEDYTGHEKFRNNTEKLLRDQEFPKNKLGVNSSYPFNWLTYKMAERSVRMSFNLWRSFAKELGKEDEFLNGVPRP